MRLKDGAVGLRSPPIDAPDGNSNAQASVEGRLEARAHCAEYQLLGATKWVFRVFPTWLAEHAPLTRDKLPGVRYCTRAVQLVGTRTAMQAHLRRAQQARLSHLTSGEPTGFGPGRFEAPSSGACGRKVAGHGGRR